jgi:hypothetical protein
MTMNAIGITMKHHLGRPQTPSVQDLVPANTFAMARHSVTAHPIGFELVQNLELVGDPGRSDRPRGRRSTIPERLAW